MASYSTTIDGFTLPALLGGHPALDFCNTFAGWNGPPTKEYLLDYAHLTVWTEYAGLLPRKRAAALRRAARRDESSASRVLAGARAFRASVYSLFLGGDAAEPVIALVNKAASLQRLTARRAGYEFELAPQAGLSAPLFAIAASVGRLLTDPQLELVSACPGAGCGWLFLDSRGRRRWCTMATCGNRAKVRRFAERHRGDP
jgi:predicted RNA-binding Zn ribbon-like protein